jgi:predicted flap endonuclease-1-like 5' DNA nuclease
MAKLIDIEGIGPVLGQKLSAAGLETTEDLLRTAGAASARDALAAKTGITAAQLLEWVNRADLMRIKGVGSEYSDLLEAAGVDTVRELGTRVPENLHTRLVAVNDEKKLVRRAPTADEVAAWVSEAKTLPAAVTH